MALIEAVRRALDYIEEPRLLQARWRGISVPFVEEFIALQRRFNVLPKTVIDVGASRGEYMGAAMFLFPETRFVAFEPVPKLYEQLRRRFPTAAVFPFALSNRESKQTFHIAALDVLSSLLPYGKDLHSLIPNSGEVERIEVTTKRFDMIVDLSEYVKPILMKLDVQGMELAVLQGAARQLSFVDLVVLECNFDQLYRGQAQAEDVISYMRRNGFDRFVQTELVVKECLPSWCNLVFMRRWKSRKGTAELRGSSRS